MVNDMEFAVDYLVRAESYAHALGDGNFFKEAYTCLRQENSVQDSVWFALQYLYGSYVADQLQISVDQI